MPLTSAAGVVPPRLAAEGLNTLGTPGLPIREYLLVGLTAAVVTFLLVGLVRVLAVRFGAVAWDRKSVV